MCKKVKTTFRISEKPVSVGYIGICELQKICDIKDKYGLGDREAEILQFLPLRYLQEYEAGKIYLCSRTLAHAGNVQKEFQEIEIISYEQRYEIMKQCDIVVSATSAPHVVVKQEYYTPEKQVTFLDLATPRDIDPKLSDDAKVKSDQFRYDQRDSKANQSERGRTLQTKQYDGSAKQKKKRCSGCFRAPMEETIRSLQEKCTEIVEDSYSLFIKKNRFWNKRAETSKEGVKCILAAHDQRTDSGIKTFRNKTGTSRYKKMVEQLFWDRDKERKMTYEIYHRIKRITPCN